MPMRPQALKYLLTSAVDHGRFSRSRFHSPAPGHLVFSSAGALGVAPPGEVQERCRGVQAC